MIAFRQADVNDIAGIQVVRNAVRENRLSNPSLVTDADCEDYILRRGRGWVALQDGVIIGFAIADLQDRNVWALFVDPDSEGNGVGSRLHALMLEWYFGQHLPDIWLSTAPGTRAEQFYRMKGWEDAGFAGKEHKFTLTREQWERLRP